MRIRLSAPVELENLLPYDFNYRIYDKNTKKDWTNFLRKGGLSPVHVVQLSHLLLISVEMQDTGNTVIFRYVPTPRLLTFLQYIVKANSPSSIQITPMSSGANII